MRSGIFRFSGIPIVFILGAIFLIFLAPFFYAFGFCYPRGDDYDGITRSMFLFDLPGALYEVGREWLTWSGRYIYHFLAVFLGKAAASPFSYGLVCLFILSLFPLAFYKLGLSARLKRGPNLCFALAALCVLLGCHGNLPDFYLLTDALTIILQAGLYLLFLAQIFFLWRSSAIGKIQSHKRSCIILGILAIGVYEHAGMAVFWTIIAVFGILYLSEKKSSQFNRMEKALISISFWVGGALLLSFLAVGNFQRGSARDVNFDRQLAQLSSIPVDFLDFLEKFFLSWWPLAILALVAILRLYSPASHYSKNFRFYLCIIFSFLFFSLSLLFLHALSDVPFAAEAKLSASLEIYMALAFGLCLFFIPCPLPASGFHRRFLILFFSFTLSYILVSSTNFHKTVINAANGQMLEYRAFMKERAAWLAEVSREVNAASDRFGLIGEILDGDTRNRKVNAAMGEAIVESFPRPVFPVHMGLGLSQDPSGWPNLWAAWVHGIGSISEIPPDPARALAAIQAGEGRKLTLTGPLISSGLTDAWLYLDKSGPNPTFHNIWLVISSSAPTRILKPALPNRARLLPFFLQKKLYENFRKHDVYEENFMTPLVSSRLEASSEESMKAIWLGPLYAPRPLNLFASIDGLTYHKIYGNFIHNPRNSP